MDVRVGAAAAHDEVRVVVPHEEAEVLEHLAERGDAGAALVDAHRLAEVELGVVREERRKLVPKTAVDAVAVPVEHFLDGEPIFGCEGHGILLRSRPWRSGGPYPSLKTRRKGA